MRKLYAKQLLVAVVALTAACNLPQKKGTTYVFKEIGWTVTLPPQFTVMDAARTQRVNEKGKAMMEKAAGTKLDLSSTQTLISANKGASGANFNATITPFDPQKDGDLAAANQAMKELLYTTFSNQMPDATLDSSSDVTRVGRLDFDRYRLTISVKGKTLFTTVVLTRLYKGFDLAITYLYTDPLTELQFQSILASSKFQ